MSSAIDFKAVKTEAKQKFRIIPGVVGFGIGDGTLIVYVTEPSVAERLPTEFMGAKVEVIVTGKVVAY